MDRDKFVAERLQGSGAEGAGEGPWGRFVIRAVRTGLLVCLSPAILVVVLLTGLAIAVRRVALLVGRSCRWIRHGW